MVAVTVPGKKPRIFVMPDGNRLTTPLDELVRRLVFRPTTGTSEDALPEIVGLVPSKHRLDWFHPASGEVKHVYLRNACNAAFSGNGQRLAVASTHGEITVFDLEGGEPNKIANFELSRKDVPAGLSFNSNGLLLYVLQASGHCVLLDILHKEVLGEMTAGNETWKADFHAYAMAGHPDILSLSAYAGTSSSVYFMSHTSRYTFSCDAGIGDEIHSLHFGARNLLVATGPRGVSLIKVDGSSATVYQHWRSEREDDRVVAAAVLGDNLQVLFAHGHKRAVYDDKGKLIV